MSKKLALLLFSYSFTLFTLVGCDNDKAEPIKDDAKLQQPAVGSADKKAGEINAKKTAEDVKDKTSNSQPDVVQGPPRIPIEKPTKDDVIKLFRITSKDTQTMAGPKWTKFIKVLGLATELQEGEYFEDAAVEWTKAYKLLFEINDENRRERLPNGDIKLGKVTLHVESKEISFPAKMNFAEDMPVEVICCRQNGRVHETLTVTEARPLHIQTILYALGASNGHITADNPKVPQGDIIDFFLEYKNAKGKLITRPIEDFLTDDATGKRLPNYGWVFVGSVMHRGVFSADATGDLAVTFSVGSAVFDVNNMKLSRGMNHVSGKKLGGLDTDSPVRVIIRVRPRKVKAQNSGEGVEEASDKKVNESNEAVEK